MSLLYLMLGGDSSRALEDERERASIRESEEQAVLTPQLLEPEGATLA